MGFAVAPDLVIKYADVVQEQGNHADKAHQYATTNLDIEIADEGLINLMTSAHKTVREQVEDSMQHLATLCAATQVELRRTATFYQNTDMANAARLDSTYPGHDSNPMPPIVTRAGTAGVKELNPPEGRLTLPVTPPEFQNPLTPINAVSNFLSPTWWINNVLKETINVDAFGAASTFFGGNWEAYAKCANVFHCLSYFCSDVHDNIHLNALYLSQTWQGHAAESAYEYFNSVANSLDSYQQALVQLRDLYQSESKGVWEAAEGVGDLLQDISDNIFWAGVEALGGWVLSETAVGTAALWAAAALQCRQIVEDWEKITGIINTVQKSLLTAVGTIQTITEAGKGMSQNPLPTGNYISPAGR